jgi:hypothetical protein
MYLRCVIHAQRHKWNSWLALAEFWYNTTLGSTPFKVLYGYEAPMSASLKTTRMDDQILQYWMCKENGPRAFWLIEFWCLMNNTIRELISFLVFVFVVHRMRRELDQGNEDATPQKKT